MTAVRPSRKKEYIWHMREEQPEQALALAAEYGVNPLVARILANRGLAHAGTGFDEFLRPSLSRLHDPFLLKDMKVAADRITHAIRTGERIVIYGDYDTDGVTSTSLLLKLFRFLAVEAEYYIPHRVEEGYGLGSSAIEALAARKTQLLITVDTGITAVEQVKLAASLGIDVVVTDHHQPGTELPPACAVVNPNRLDCTYPFKGLTGVGVAFKLAHALLKTLEVSPTAATEFLRSVLELVAVGTIADVAPIIGENRILVRHGLDQIARTASPGLRALKDAAQVPAKVTTYNVGFQLAPRLNAAGRTDDARICVELLTTDDEATAWEIAQQLEAFNRERRSVEQHILADCLRYVEENIDLERERVLVVHGDTWHVGVIGIVASRLLDVYHRPTVILTGCEAVAKGSCRSIRAFNICKALEHCRSHLKTFGGHPAAAGLQLDPANLVSFREAINVYAAEVLTENDLFPTLQIDALVEPQMLDVDIVESLRVLEPHGIANPSPVLAMQGVRLAAQPRVVGTNHLKLTLAAEGRRFSAIGFNMAPLAGELARTSGVTLDIAFCPSISTFYSPASVELEIKDLKVSALS